MNHYVHRSSAVTITCAHCCITSSQTELATVMYFDETLINCSLFSNE